MMKQISIFLLWAIFCMAAPVKAQQETPVIPQYFEKENDTTFRFYFNRNYYLVDKNCPFVQIQRVITYNLETKTFHGGFADIDAQNRVILEGTYQDGLKHGWFTAYHPNGEIKWEVEYHSNNPVGLWTFYYPDGLPALELNMNPSRGIEVVNYWKQNGKLGVKKGKGKFEFKLKEKGFSEFGNEYYIRSGRILNGKPNGRWLVHLLNPDGSKVRRAVEFYDVGKLTYARDYLQDFEYTYSTEFDWYPIEPFERAEQFMTKSCTIDDDMDFNTYLTEVFNTWFENTDVALQRFIQLDVKLTISDEGKLISIDSDSLFDADLHNVLLKQAIRAVPFWYPSYDGQQFITDQLNISALAYPSGSGGRSVKFGSLHIRRSKGF